MARSTPIAPLTGVRLVAAIWVVSFHIYLFNGDWLGSEHPQVDAVVGPIASQGDLGVDLFFLLSGFVLAHNYLGRLGSDPSLRSWLAFLWLRIARIWPLYLVAIIGGGLLLWLRLEWWGTAPNVPLSWGRFAQQVLMVQQWGAPYVPDTSWTGPAWSISAEWLAYLAFPALAIVVEGVRRRAGRAVAGTLAAGVLVPTLIWTSVAQTQAAPYLWLARLASEFTCGMLLSAALSTETVRLRRASSWLGPAAVAVAVGWLYAAAVLDRPWLGPLALILFPVVIASLALGDGPLQRWLGSPTMVLGGGVSFALYLVHVPLLKLFRDGLAHGAVPLDESHQAYGELVVAAASLVLALALFRHVEEPTRRRLRALGPRVSEVVARLPVARRVRRPRMVVPASRHLEPEVEPQPARVAP